MIEIEKKRYPKPPDFKPEKYFPSGHKKAGQLRCQAWNPNKGAQCELNPIKGKTKCGSHGGRSLEGPASPSFKGGRYSKYLPARLAPLYEEMQADQDFLSLRDDINLIDARLAELLCRTGAGESRDTMEAIRNLVGEYNQAVIDKNGQTMANAILRIGRLAAAGIDASVAWEEIYRLLEQRRRLVESQRKMLVEMQQTMTAERALMLFSVMAEDFKQILLKYCDKSIVRYALAEFASGVGRLMNLNRVVLIDGQQVREE